MPRLLSTSRYFSSTSRYHARRCVDEIDGLLEAWQRERPDLDVAPLAVLRRVTRLARHLDRERRAAFAEHGLEAYEFDVLTALRRAGPPYELTPGQLVRETLVGSGHHDQPAGPAGRPAGWSTAGPTPSDGRARRVRLTDAGRDRADAAVADLLDRERQLLGGLSERRPDTLAALLRTVLVNFEDDRVDRGALSSDRRFCRNRPIQSVTVTDAAHRASREEVAIDCRPTRPIRSTQRPRDAVLVSTRSGSGPCCGCATSAGCGWSCRSPASATGSACWPRRRWRPSSPTVTRRPTSRSAACSSSGCCRRSLFGPLAGAFADRFDRRKLMVVADLGRFALFLSIPLVGALWWLFVATFLVECFSLFWIPAKEASVPNLIRKDQLEAANQVSLVTTYGITPVAAALAFSALALLTRLLADRFEFFVGNRVDLALYINALTFLVSALTVQTIRRISGRPVGAGGAPDPGRAAAGASRAGPSSGRRRWSAG